MFTINKIQIKNSIRDASRQMAKSKKGNAKFKYQKNKSARFFYSKKTDHLTTRPPITDFPSTDESRLQKSLSQKQEHLP